MWRDRANLTREKEELRKAGEPNVFLPILFCSPTMELSIEISALNAVYLRNVPRPEHPILRPLVGQSLQITVLIWNSRCHVYALLTSWSYQGWRVTGIVIAVAYLARSDWEQGSIWSTWGFSEEKYQCTMFGSIPIISGRMTGSLS